jgi:hypothetical protein
LNACSEFVVVLSPSAVESNNVLNEIALAEEEGKTIIPILLEDCRFPLRLRRLQYSDFRNNYSLGFESLRLSLADVSQLPVER